MLYPNYIVDDNIILLQHYIQSSVSSSRYTDKVTLATSYDGNWQEQREEDGRPQKTTFSETTQYYNRRFNYSFKRTAYRISLEMQ